MSESNHAEDLNSFEARLAQLSPRSAQVDRDEILFQAGRHSAYQQQRRIAQRWCAACALLACVVGGQWIWLASRDLPRETPVIADITEGPTTLEPATEIVEPREAASPASEPVLAVNAASHPERRTSLWAQLLPLPSPNRTAVVLGQPLSVGCSVQGTLAESFTLPQPGSMPSQDQLPLLSMRRSLLPE